MKKAISLLMYLIYAVAMLPLTGLDIFLVLYDIPVVGELTFIYQILALFLPHLFIAICISVVLKFVHIVSNAKSALIICILMDVIILGTALYTSIFSLGSGSIAILALVTPSIIAFLMNIASLGDSN